jgi:hypothetical protein
LWQVFGDYSFECEERQYISPGEMSFSPESIPLSGVNQSSAMAGSRIPQRGISAGARQGHDVLCGNPARIAKEAFCLFARRLPGAPGRADSPWHAATMPYFRICVILAATILHDWSKLSILTTFCKIDYFS